MVVDISKMDAYATPISDALFGNLAIVLVVSGLLTSIWFFIGGNDVTATKKSRNWFKDLFGALVSSVLLGFGTVFLFLWVGIYV